MMNQDNLASTENQMLPKGYKKTDLGLIPEDWTIKSFEQVTSKIGDGIHSTPIYNCTGEYYFINGNNLVAGSILIDGETKKISSKEFRKYKQILSGKTILLSINGTIGNRAFYNAEPVLLGKSAAFLNINGECSVPYIYYVLGSKRTLDQFNDGLTGSTIKNLGLGTIRNTLIPMPILAEQEKIATALSDTDALISELEKLIEKKQAIKTATMQQLLTGKTRLPEFALREDGTPKGYKDSELGQIPEDWEAIRIGSALTIKHGKSQKLVESNDGKFPILATGGQIGWAKEYLYNKPSVLIGRKGTINKPRFIDQPFWSVDTLFYSEINEKYCAKFLFYKFCRIDWNNYNEASGVPSLNAKTIENVLISISSLDEQKQIVKCLHELDTEIIQMVDKLRKLIDIKKGMMQELLTGKTRLV